MRSLLLQIAGLSAILVFGAGAVRGDSIPPEVAVSPPLTINAERLAAWVLDANPGLAAIQAAAEAAAFRIKPAGSLDDPTLGYGVAPLTADADKSLNQKIDFGQKLPWPGTLTARKIAARYDAVAMDRDVDALQLQVVAQAKAAFAEWHYVDSALDIHHATKTLLDELIATAQTRYAAGRALKQDVLHAEIEQANLDKQLLTLMQLQATVQARINALLNRDVDAPLPVAEPIELRSSVPKLVGLQTLALSQHPDLARLDARIAASDSRITLAEKAFYPDFQVGVSYDSLWEDTDKRLVFGVAINLPLDRSKRRATLGQARASKQQVEWSLIERRAELLADVAQARAQLVEAHSSVALYQEQLVPLASEYLEAALADYRSGSGAFLNVIMAERRTLDTALALARARADYARRGAELERWVGGAIDAVPTKTNGEAP